MTRNFLLALAFAICPALSSMVCLAQVSVSGPRQSELAFDTEGVSPSRFIAVHGRRALIDGYATHGLEVWGYPFEILSDYRIAFREQGATTPLDGQDILSRIVYEPESVTRIYLGPDFIVRERISVPLDQPAAILTYQVESRRTVAIEVHATPVLDLMWPAGLGGQSTVWNSGLSAFVLTEPLDGYSAVVGSAEIVDHDEMDNRTARNASSGALAFTLLPDLAGTATVYIALNPGHAADQGALLRKLISERPTMEAEASAHLQQLEQSGLKITTPDPQINQAIAWAQVALDQAWVCNPELGCGFVAGYGPSRGARRPQYDWFFAGDGLVATDASIASGDFTHARQELEFILRYQDAKTGMIWHELSQSAGLIDWIGKFPYMFVHVDISFQFVSTFERYVAASGDVGFVRDHWEQIESAYAYCRSVIDPASGLPHIPADKEGGDEQDRTVDDLGLSVSWVQAAAGFAHLARLAGHAALADRAAIESQHAAAAIAGTYWNAEQKFWVSGHTAAGSDAPERRSSPAEALTMELFNPAQKAAVLDQLASSAFETDWGTRSVGAGSTGYDPASYAKGSVWAVGTGSLAQAFWSEHRPATAAGLWRTLVPWSLLDSPGHMDEVMAGDVYRPQGESVPEQTWSSAGFLQATIEGLLGLTVDGLDPRVTFAPHLPAEWGSVSLENIRLPNTSAALVMQRTEQGLLLSIDNAGPDLTFVFVPELPLGARLDGSSLAGRPIAATLQSHPQETDARVSFTAPHGKSRLQLDFDGGVSVMVDPPMPKLGDASSGIRIVEVRLKEKELTIEADVRADRQAQIRLQTAWGIARVVGADWAQAGNGRADLTIAASTAKTFTGFYRHVTVTVQFKP